MECGSVGEGAVGAVLCLVLFPAMLVERRPGDELCGAFGALEDVQLAGQAARHVLGRGLRNGRNLGGDDVRLSNVRSPGVLGQNVGLQLVQRGE